MASLNEIVDSIAHRMGDPLNIMLRERLKFTVKAYRALFIRRNPQLSNFNFYQKIVGELIPVDKADSCVVNVDCIVLRSKNKIPYTVRRDYLDVPFQTIGNADFTKIFISATPGELNYVKKLADTFNEPRYIFTNQYLYVYGNTKFGYFAIRDIFGEPDKVKDDCSDVPCYTDDSEFPLSMDYVALITDQIVQGELKILNPEEEIKIDKEP